jgi:hypothetical protein
LPLQQYDGCQSCYRGEYRKSLVLSYITVCEMLVLL